MMHLGGKSMDKKKKFKFKIPSAYTVLLLLMVIIAIVTQFIPDIKNVTLPDLIMAPINGMIGVRDVTLNNAVNEARIEGGIHYALEVLTTAEGPLISVGNTGQFRGGIDVALFVLIIGGFLGVVAKTGALDAGVGFLVNRLKGKELVLIPVLMFVFSMGGTSYGMAEETLAFYALITVAMLKAGFDPLVSMATIMIGSGVGVLGSTVNPFAVGAAIAAAQAAGTSVSQGTTIAIGTALWLSTVGISIWYVMRYAKKVYKNRDASLLTPVEWEEVDESFTGNEEQEVLEFTGKRKLVIALFFLSFVVMIMGVIPWNDFGITVFDNTTAWLTGEPLGWWWFPELTIWFFIMSLVVGLIYGLKENDLVAAFISGAADMIGVAFIIGISRGISFMMSNSGLDLYILEQAVNILSGVSGAVFANMSFIIYLGLTFLIPSTSGLASVSMPIFAPLAERLSIAPEIVIGAFTSAAGFVGLFTPTSAVLMGGLTITKVGYGTWLKFTGKLLGLIFLAIIAILTISSMILAI